MNTSDNSWIKLPRSFAKWRWYHDSNMVHLYLYLLLNANIQDEEYFGTIIHRGEIYVSIPTMACMTGLSIQSIKTCLKKLKMTKEIDFKRLGRGKITILVDFNQFQPIGLDEQNPNWIQLYRKICDWRWYKNSKISHLFVHLMVKTNVDSLPNGISIWQCKTTFRKLNCETGISMRSLRTCIEKLQSTGEIIYEVSPTHSYSTITICKYDTYQVIKSKSNRVLTDYSPNNNRVLTEYLEEDNQLPTQGNEHISNCDSSTYQVIKSKSNRVLTDYSPNNNRVLTEYSPNNNREITAVKEYKNRRKEEEKNIGFIVDDARAHVRDFVEVSEVKMEEGAKENEQKKVEKESFADKVLGEQVWLQAIQKKFKLPSIDAVKQKLDEFETDLICRGKEEHKDERDYKSHFCDWLAKVGTSQTKCSPSPPLSNQYPKERWPGEKYVPKSLAGYGKKF